MRISELSRLTGVPVATVKYYLREGLLPPGEPTARNQADYGDDHVRRLRLVRVLVETGGLGIAAVREVLRALDNDATPLHDLLGTVQYALAPARSSADLPDDVRAARAEVDAYLDGLGWHISPEAPSRRTLADALVALRRLGYPVTTDLLDPYAEHLDELAGWEVATLPGEAPRAALVELMVLGEVVLETVLVALRRLAHEHHSAARFGAATPG